MDVPSTSTGKTRKRNADKPSLTDIAAKYITMDGNMAICRIDVESGCKYIQTTFDVGNFIRHFRKKHTEMAKSKHLFSDPESTFKKPRTVAKRSFPIDKQLYVDSAVKLVAYHNLPLNCFEWEGLKQLFDPIGSALGVILNRTNIKDHLKSVAGKIRLFLTEEMQGMLICLKVDSASRFNRKILGINAQYEVDGKVVIRTLGMLEVNQRQTAKMLKGKILEVISSYGVTLEQIFAITVDNGANMVSMVKELKMELEKIVITGDIDDDDYATEQKLTHELSEELQNHINLIRCAAHTLQLAILDVVNKSDKNVKEITEIAKRCKNIKYKISFEFHGAAFPPIWSQTRWAGIYKMIESFKNQENFFKNLAEEFPELDLSNHWTFINDYYAAFGPLYVCTKDMQAAHMSLSEFYIRWLKAISDIKKQVSNPFVTELSESLTKRLTRLRESRAFKMSLYLDPRFTYLNSKIFNAEEKDQIQGYILDTWTRICQLIKPESIEKSIEQVTNTSHEFDDFLTEMFGGSVPNDTENRSFLQQLKALDSEPRQTHDYDVWRHWLERKNTHPELYGVAMVVLSTPSTQVSVERSFSALALVLSDHRVSLGEETLDNTLLIKLNKELLERAMVTLYGCKDNPPVVLGPTPTK